MTTPYTITDAELARRKRVADLAADITETIAKHAADKMTVLEILAALNEQQGRFIGMGLREEREDA